MHFDEARSWSVLSPYPQFSGNVVWWRGAFMSRATAFCIAATKVMKYGATPKMKMEMWESTKREYLAAVERGVTFSFDIEMYNHDSAYKLLVYRLGAVEIPEWEANPIAMYKYFFVDSE